ncbi:hypothetical protein [Segniliparus rotundus]|nr:hypothetical protein [Segniliparus rotundus]
MDDPQAAGVVEKLATGLDNYFACSDRGEDETGGSDLTPDTKHGGGA